MSAWTIQARRDAARTAALLLAGAALAACAGGPRADLGSPGVQGAPTSRYTGYKVGKPYQVKGVWYTPREQPNYDETGIASWYGAQFHNRYTADGEVFDMNMPSAAHKTLPLPSLVEVTNLANGRTLVVRVNDRGPFVDGRVIDLSKEAAAQLGFVTAGLTRVRVRYVGRAPDPPGVITPRPPSPEPRLQQASAGRRPTPPPPPAPDLRLAAAAPKAAAAGSAAVQPAREALPEVERLLAEASPAAAPASAPMFPPGASYELQAGAFPSEEAAQRFAGRLTGGGLPEVQPVQQGGQTVYRVVVHGLADPIQAAAARNEAMALGAPDPQIVSGS